MSLEKPTPEELEKAKRFLARLKEAQRRGELLPKPKPKPPSGFRARSERTPRDIRFVN